MPALQNRWSKDLDAATRRTRIAALLASLESLHIQDEEIAEALGVEMEYFRRVRAEATPSRAMTTSSARFLNEGLHRSLWGIVSLLESRSGGRRETGQQYEDRVVAELSRLRKGDRQTLVCAPPPLELVRQRVVETVVDAAGRGVRFRYYYPCGETLSRQWREGVAQRREVQDWLSEKQVQLMQKDAKRMAVFDGVFFWLDRVETVIDSIMMKIWEYAGRRHGQPAFAKFATYQEAVRENIRFGALKCLPVSFNEKIVWISTRQQGNSEHTIRKEIYLGNEGELIRDVYDDKQRWAWHEYPMKSDVLGAVIRLSRRWTPSGFDQRAWPGVSTTKLEPRPAAAVRSVPPAAIVRSKRRQTLAASAV